MWTSTGQNLALPWDATEVVVKATMLAASTNFVLNLEAVGVLLGGLVSITILLGLLIQFVDKINRLESKVKYLHTELIEHSSVEGHKQHAEQALRTADNINRVERALELHLQDYTNRKESVQFLLGQLDEKIAHKFSRVASSIDHVQKYLEEDGTFKIREPFSDAEKRG